VARRVRERSPALRVETEEEPLRLLDLWAGAGTVVVVDAALGTGPPGTVSVFDVSRESLPTPFFAVSTHHVSLGEAIELARALGSLPPDVVVVAIEGSAFVVGTPLSAHVEAAVPAAAEEVLRCTSKR